MSIEKRIARLLSYTLTPADLMTPQEMACLCKVLRRARHGYKPASHLQDFALLAEFGLAEELEGGFYRITPRGIRQVLASPHMADRVTDEQLRNALESCTGEPMPRDICRTRMFFRAIPKEQRPMVLAMMVGPAYAMPGSDDQNLHAFDSSEEQL